MAIQYVNQKNFRILSNMGIKILKDALFLSNSLIRAHIIKRKIPLSVVFSITNRCNFRCLYCSIWQRNEKELTTQQIFSLIDELSQLGTKRFGLFGGEPLLREDCGKVIKYAKKKGMYVSLDTNGFLVPEKIEEIKYVDKLILSFDGPKKIHDMLKKKGSYEKVIESIKLANEYNIPVWTITVLTKYNTNKKCINFVLKKAKKLGFQTYYQILLHTPKMGRNTQKLLPSKKQHKRILRKLIQEKIKGSPIVCSLKYLEYMYYWPNFGVTRFVNFPAKKWVECWAGILYCNINSNGDIYPCFNLLNDIKPTNCMKLGFKKAFENLPPQKCWGCTSSSYNEQNFLFSLNLCAILNILEVIR